MEASCLHGSARRELIVKSQKKIKSVEGPLLHLSRTFALAGNDVRLKILYLLLQGEEPVGVCELSDILGISVPAVSRHLRKLKEGRLIQCRRKGSHIFCSLKKEQLPVLLPLLRHLAVQEAS